MADNDKDSDEERRERIKTVIERIRTRRTGGKKLKKIAQQPASKKADEPTEMKEMDAANQEKGKKKGSGRHTMYKLHIGWRHYRQSEFRQITSRRGGGIRKIEFNINDPQTVESITEVGKRLFFPNGKNSYGNLGDMEVTLTHYSGEIIERFCNIDGQPCTFQEFLKSTGRYSSQFYVYLSTKNIVDDKIKPYETTSQTSYLANGKIIPELHMQYSKTKTSVYSGDTSIVTCHTIKECRDLSGIPDDIEEYEPLEDGYRITYLSINDKVYMERTSSGLSFPQHATRQDNACILHGPSEICGMNEGKVFLGVITDCSEDVSCTWYRNESIHATGINLNLIHINNTGSYNVNCQVGETLYTFEEPVKITLQTATDSNATCYNTSNHTNVQINSELIKNQRSTSSGTAVHQTLSDPLSAVIVPEMQSGSEMSKHQSTSFSGIPVHKTYSDPLSTDIVPEMQSGSEMSKHQSTSFSGIPVHKTYSDPLSTDIVSEMQSGSEMSKHQRTSFSGIPVHKTYSDHLSTDIVSEMQSGSEMSKHQSTSFSGIPVNKTYSDPLSTDIVPEMQSGNEMIKHQSTSFSGIPVHKTYSDPLSTVIVSEMQSGNEMIKHQSTSFSGIPVHKTYSDPLSTDIAPEMQSGSEMSKHQSTSFSGIPVHKTYSDPLSTDIAPEMQSGSEMSKHQSTSFSGIPVHKTYSDPLSADIVPEMPPGSEMSKNLCSTVSGITVYQIYNDPLSADIVPEMLSSSEMSNDQSTSFSGIPVHKTYSEPPSADIVPEMPSGSEMSKDLSSTVSGITVYQIYNDPLSADIVPEMLSSSEMSNDQSTSFSGIPVHKTYSEPLSADIVPEMPYFKDQSSTHSGIAVYQTYSVSSRKDFESEMLICSEVSEDPTEINSSLGPNDGKTGCAGIQINRAHEQKLNSKGTLHATSADIGFTLESSKCDSVVAQEDSHERKTVMEAVFEIPSSHLQLKKEINKGAFGVVWKAVWNETVVAVKKIPVKRLKKCKHLLDRELKVNASIRHPNLVLFMGYNIEGNELQLVTEYMNGFNLDQILFDDLEIELPLEKRLSIGYQISAAVAYLHSRNPAILHRDIKPENVVLSKCMCIAKLCDMGLSKFKSFTTAITTIAGGCGTQPGTLVYKAPEVCLSNESASKATDVWSLSALLVELLSDELIWEESDDSIKDENSFEKYMFESMKEKKQPDALKSLIDKVLPVEIKDVLMNGLNYKPVPRPSAINICQVFRANLEY